MPKNLERVKTAILTLILILHLSTYNPSKDTNKLNIKAITFVYKLLINQLEAQVKSLRYE